MGLRREVDQGEGAFVGPAFHLGAGEGLAGRLPALAERLLQQRFGDDELLLAVRRDDVADLGVRGDRRVGDQRPGCGRPDQQRRLAGQRARRQGEADEDRGVDDRLVPLGQLVVGQAGAAAGAPGGDAVVLDQQVLGEDLLQRPPHGVHVLRVHRAVRVVQVDPVAHPGRQLGEGVGVPGHRLTALGVELGDAVRLDVLLAVEAQLLLDRQLDRQAVAVPAGLAAHVVALHGAEAGEDVLEDAGLDVVGARHAVGGGRSLVEDPLGAALGLLQALGEDLALAPEVEHGVLQRGKVDLGGHLAVLRRCHVRLPPADVFHFRRRDESVSAPAVPPSLAPGVRPRPPHWGAMPGLVAPRRGVHGPGCSSGGSGVIFTTRSPPGSHRPRVALGCVRRYSSRPCLSLGPVYGPVRATADRLSGVRGRDPCGGTGPRDRRRGQRAGLPGGELGTTVGGVPRPDAGEGERAACPVAAGLESIYRPSTIREQDHNM